MANETARLLRKHPTSQETKLWSELRQLPKSDFHFGWQVPIGTFIVDFAEKRLRLVIAVDGSQHAEPLAQQRDAERDAFLRGRGYRILRFWNHNIDTNMSGVIDTILLRLKT